MATFIIRSRSDFKEVFTEIQNIAVEAGMNRFRETQLITAVSELLTNVLKYAHEGKVEVDMLPPDEKKGIRVNIIDKGPGIVNIDSAMTTGYSTGNTLGLGLPGARKLTDQFEIKTVLGEGTCISIIKYV